MPEVVLTYSRLRKIITLIFVCLLLAVFAVALNKYRLKARDVKRKADLVLIGKALNLYYSKHAFYPEKYTPDWRGWDTSIIYEPGPEKQNGFLDILKQESFIDQVPVDPISNALYHYRYAKFPPGSYGCERGFYILQVSNFEYLSGEDKDHGSGACPEINFVKLAPRGYTIQGFD